MTTSLLKSPSLFKVFWANLTILVSSCPLISKSSSSFANLLGILPTFSCKVYVFISGSLSFNFTVGFARMAKGSLFCGKRLFSLSKSSGAHRRSERGDDKRILWHFCWGRNCWRQYVVLFVILLTFSYDIGCVNNHFVHQWSSSFKGPHNW